jgi:hypothetical protein
VTAYVGDLISSPDRGDGLCRATAQSPSCLSAVRSAGGLVPDFVRGGPLMRRRRPVVPVPRALRLRKVTVLVPDSSVEGLRQFARELCPGGKRWGPPMWPGSGGSSVPAPSCWSILGAARGVRSGTLELPPGPDRYHWAVTLLGEPDPVTMERTGELAEARSAQRGRYSLTWRAGERGPAGASTISRGQGA